MKIKSREEVQDETERDRERERGREGKINEREAQKEMHVIQIRALVRRPLSFTSVFIPAEKEDEVFSFPTHEKISLQLQI